MFASLLPLGTFTHAWHTAIAQVTYSNNVCSPRRFTWVPQVLASEVISPLVMSFRLSRAERYPLPDTTQFMGTGRLTCHS
ncbi:hypothetical protein BKA82DRAFT_3124205 [Pisolithus tinctorius]|nr:hypothetical protein BKA82DRAFT_3124205 [Pisolithus tinctorius]